ncbi:ectonucleoside triphosphate diphosphohydrolase 7 [Rhinatrema bivittatum]|uniref:ectonucleoside triphosphate diphosphohydrolase 7 n=1 Tax=Rhinatrema bivittatum TaxID=194408 RepID=UPI00112D43F8|nr:ectonucleoside triphosphate diphosphohydrolase 7 [Rhinatrema bivittatum]XP_029465949.1 ectonucleoside triphosphate diphosphohydrolase 7 [Rhinatrema bivittatum]XP_029465950.1 ectonucleoside triphosphate diphosphohydrolase 7 [Rhinatrema bivittatum]XP_029465952.1 ectonucleoside triphosphate diphosphohydrolase 7 [Rhinatrema bivittatum]XP_029465953.1 ectonucleoside triphosphate diphosphohydrolase 7 [Rhinatrema bivittatum]XP_029465954.1 ectonucleoside triphosphate diphosphohydrolase 7 [Rhinatrema
MARISFSCLYPVSWHFSVPPISPFARRHLAFLTLFILVFILMLIPVTDLWLRRSGAQKDRQFEKYLARVGDLEATDTQNPSLNYGIVVDCGSSGSRVFVYFWPQHNGNPHDLLDIKQMRDQSSKPVVKKIKPGISVMASTPDKASDYMFPLLSFAAAHVPAEKHKETPLYILCTAGMRVLPEREQMAIIEDLVRNVPLKFGFLFSESHVEVISGKQEGVYAWISINFVLGRFDHIEDDDEAVVAVTVGNLEEFILRKRTVGIIDMGGGSLQIAYEVPSSVTFSSPEKEEAAKAMLAEFNLGCDLQHTEHVYRVYVTTFLGFGGNYARQRYEDMIFNETVTRNRLLAQETGMRPDSPYLDPCLPAELTDTVERSSQALHLRGKGEWDACRQQLEPLLLRSNASQAYMNGVYQSPIDFTNSEFYGFSEFFYCTEDVLRMGGEYNSYKFAKAAQDYCSMTWSALTQRFHSGLFSSHADQHRLKYQCFKSAWMYQVLHDGFRFPYDYPNLRTAQLVYDREVQWTLGAILFKTRFLPLRDIRQESNRPAHVNWFRVSFVYNHYLFFVCILVVLLAIVLYILRLRRIHRRQARLAMLDLWMEEAVPTTPAPGI